MKTKWPDGTAKSTTNAFNWKAFPSQINWNADKYGRTKESAARGPSIFNLSKKVRK